jgi:hypothetical protein
MIDTAREIVALLPPEEAGTCVLEVGGGLLRVDPAGLTAALEVGRVRFHRGSIRGALPRLVQSTPHAD